MICPVPVSGLSSAGVAVESGNSAGRAERPWAPIIAAAHTVATSTFAELLIRRTMDFSQERPAYFTLRAASVKFSRSSTARQNLRDSLVQAFQGKNPSLSPDNALFIANVLGDGEGLSRGGHHRESEAAFGTDHRVHPDAGPLFGSEI